MNKVKINVPDNTDIVRDMETYNKDVTQLEHALKSANLDGEFTIVYASVYVVYVENNDGKMYSIWVDGNVKEETYGTL